MKTTRKLIPALAMLLVSAVMLATASFAWFVSSSNATATNMEVTLKTNTKYLYIAAAADNTVDTVTTPDKLRDASTGSAQGAVATNYSTGAKLPVAYANEGFKFENSSKVEAVVENTTNTAWYTMTAKNGNLSDGDTATKTNIDPANLDNYVVKYSYFLTMAKSDDTASETGHNLQLSSFKITVKAEEGKTASDISPVKVLVAGPNGTVEVNTETGTSIPTHTLATTVTASAVTQIDVYIYFDGNHANIKNSNIANLANATFEMTLAVSDTPAGS